MAPASNAELPARPGRSVPNRLTQSPATPAHHSGPTSASVQKTGKGTSRTTRVGPRLDQEALQTMTTTTRSQDQATVRRHPQAANRSPSSAPEPTTAADDLTGRDAQRTASTAKSPSRSDAPGTNDRTRLVHDEAEGAQASGPNSPTGTWRRTAIRRKHSTTSRNWNDGSAQGGGPQGCQVPAVGDRDHPTWSCGRPTTEDRADGPPAHLQAELAGARRRHRGQPRSAQTRGVTPPAAYSPLHALHRMRSSADRDSNLVRTTEGTSEVAEVLARSCWDAEGRLLRSEDGIGRP